MTPRNLRAVQLARIRSRGRVQHVFTANCEPHEDDPYHTLYEVAVKNCDCLVAVSHAVAEGVARWWGRRAERIVPNGFDEELYHLPPGGAAREGFILYASAMIPRKHPEFLLKLAERMPGTRFVMVGPQPPENLQFSEPLRRKAAEMDNVEHLGKVPRARLRELMQKASALVFPSDFEGLPLTVVEAMGCGLPVVAHDASALPELIDHGSTGFLLPLEPVTLWEECLREVLAWNADQYLEFGKRARASVCAGFQWSRVAGQYHAIYREVTAPSS